MGNFVTSSASRTLQVSVCPYLYCLLWDSIVCRACVFLDSSAVQGVPSWYGWTATCSLAVAQVRFPHTPRG
jgi:hypothetical protein